MSTETAFTPGEWRTDRWQPHGTNVRGHADVSVAWCGSNCVAGIAGSHHITAKEAEANAHLIAAAPELYEALLQALDRMQMVKESNYSEFKPQCEAAIAFAEKSLAKARGET